MRTDLGRFNSDLMECGQLRLDSLALAEILCYAPGSSTSVRHVSIKLFKSPKGTVLGTHVSCG